MSTDHDVFVSRFNRMLAVCVWALCALAGVALFLHPSDVQLFQLVPPAFFAVLAAEFLWTPRLLVSDRHITVRNPLRTIVIPWNALIQVDTKFSLTLYTPGRRFAVWAAPAPGRATVHRANTSGELPVVAPFRTQEPRSGDLAGTESGDAAGLVRTRWERLQSTDRIEPGVAEETPVAVHVPVVTIIALALLFAGSLASAFLR